MIKAIAHMKAAFSRFFRKANFEDGMGGLTVSWIAYVAGRSSLCLRENLRGVASLGWVFFSVTNLF